MLEFQITRSELSLISKKSFIASISLAYRFFDKHVTVISFTYFNERLCFFWLNSKLHLLSFHASNVIVSSVDTWAEQFVSYRSSSYYNFVQVDDDCSLAHKALA